MSYDLAFWNQEESEHRSPQAIYRALAEDGDTSGLLPYDSDALVNNLKHSFPSVEKINANQIDWQSDGSQGSFLAEFSEHHVIFACFRLSESQMNDIIESAVPLGLRLYDPQVDRRYAG